MYKLVISICIIVLVLIFSRQAFAQSHDGSVANDPIINWALTLLPEQYIVQPEKVVLISENKLSQQWRQLLNRRSAFHIPGAPWVGVIAESELYLSAKNNQGNSADLYILASVIYHEYWHMKAGHKGAGWHMTKAERKISLAEELDALNHQKAVLIYFLKQYKVLNEDAHFHAYMKMLDQMIIDNLGDSNTLFAEFFVGISVTCSNKPY